MTDLKVVTTLRYEGPHWDRLAAALDGAEIRRFDSPDAAGFFEALAQADIALVAQDTDERFYRLPKLRWIHIDHAGLNRAARPEAFRPGLMLTGSAGRSAPVLAEHAIFFALALTYNFGAFYDAQRAHQWGIPGQEELRGLFGRTMGIVGMGHTGQALSTRAKAFGMRVLGYRRSAGAPSPDVDRIYTADAGDTPDELLAESDFVVLALALSNATKGMIGQRELDLIGPKGFLINMARGPIVDEQALIRALYDGRIAGAGLDTFAIEPLPQHSPLWEAPRTLITPHVTPAVPDRTARSLDIICENIRRFRLGEPLLNVLTERDVYSPDQKSG